MQNIIELFQGHSLAVQVFVVVFVTLLAIFLVDRFLNIYARKVSKTHNIIDDAFEYALRRPLKILILVLGISYVIEILDKELEVPLFLAINSMQDIFIVFALFIFILRFIKKVENGYIELHQGNQEKVNTINAITKLLRISVIVTTALILMQTLGINIGGVLAFGGVSGIAVGFAAKDLLSNFFGALMIYFDKPFRVGDWIRSPDKDIEGVVELIGWRQTKIRTFDKRPIYVPNSVFSVIVVENPSRMTHRRIYENIGVRYDDVGEVEKIVFDIKKYLELSDDVDKKQALIVNFNKFADSSLEIIVYCLVFETDWITFHQLKQKILLDIANIISQHKADIAYPTTRLQADPIQLESFSDTK